MSRDDFFATVRYEAPPPKERPPYLAPLLIVLGVLVLAGGGIGAWLALGGIKLKPAVMGGIPPPAVKRGAKLPWRLLEEYDWVASMEHPRPSVTVADFTGDGKQDILEIDPKSTSRIVLLDGKQKPLADAKWTYMCRFTPWDLNRDRVSELVPDPFMFAYVQTPTGYMKVRLKGGGGGVDVELPSSDTKEELAMISRGLRTPLVSMLGKAVLMLPPGDDEGRILTGDVDGDGHDDLVVQKRALIDTWLAFGSPRGVRVASFQLDHPSRGTQVADVNGDGRDDLVNNEAGTLAYYTKKTKVTRGEVAGWPNGWEPCFSADIDRDGYDEIIACHAQIADRTMYDAEGNIKAAHMPKGSDTKSMIAWQDGMTKPKGGIFYPKTGKSVEFEFPEMSYAANPFTGVPGELAVGDPDGDGKRQVFAMPTMGYIMLVFNADGSLAYHEDFGQEALSLAIAHHGKKDYLVVQLDKQLQAFP